MTRDVEQVGMELMTVCVAFRDYFTPERQRDYLVARAVDLVWYRIGDRVHSLMGPTGWAAEMGRYSDYKQVIEQGQRLAEILNRGTLDRDVLEYIWAERRDDIDAIDDLDLLDAMVPKVQRAELAQVGD